MSGEISIRRGQLYLPAAVAETYFRGIDCVALLIREGQLVVLPVMRAAAGGCLLKVRNAAGDRVASAPDLFAAFGLEELDAAGLAASWSAEQGALLVALPEFAN